MVVYLAILQIGGFRSNRDIRFTDCLAKNIVVASQFFFCRLGTTGQVVHDDGGLYAAVGTVEKLGGGLVIKILWYRLCGNME